MNKKSGYDSTAIIIFIFFLFGLGFLIFEAMRTPAFNLFAIFPPLFATLLFLMTLFGEIIGTIYKIPNFVSLSGTIGAVVKGPITEGYHGNRVAYKISVFNRYAPQQKKKGIMGFLNLITATTTITIPDDESKFIWISNENLEAKEGCLFYMGRLDKGPMRYETFDEMLLDKLKLRSNQLKKIVSVMESVELEASNLAKTKFMDVDEMSAKLKKWADRVKRITIVPKGSGAMETIGEGEESE